MNVGFRVLLGDQFSGSGSGRGFKSRGRPPRVSGFRVLDYITSQGYTLFLICRKLILCVLFFLFQVVFVRLRIPNSSIFKSSHKMLRSDKVVELLFRARLETAEVVFSGPKMDSLSVSFSFFSISLSLLKRQNSFESAFVSSSVLFFL